MQIIKDGNNILIKGIKNGDNIPLKEIGINKRTKIKLLWTIMDEKNIYICFDPQTGKKQQRQLKDVTPIQHKNAFVEDVLHDWNIHKNHLYYNAHSTPIGTEVTILIQLYPTKRERKR